MLVILDTNVLVSAVMSSRGTCAQLLRAVRQGQLDCVVSPTLLGELERALTKRKVAPYLSAVEAGRYVDELRSLCEVASDFGGAVGVTRDPKDDYLVALAAAVGADLLVSGDKDLLEAGLVKPVIMSPRDAVERLGL